MATNDEIIRLLLDVRDGKLGAKELREEIDKIVPALDKVGDAAEKTNTRAGQLGRAISLFGQDAAQGFGVNGLAGAIQATGNNLDMLLMNLGVGGLGGILASIGYTLVPVLINGFKAAFSEEIPKAFASRIDELKDKIQELESKPIKLEVDLRKIEQAKAELDALTKARQALDELSGKQTPRERESGQAVEAAITNTEGGSALLEALRKRAVDEAMRDNPELRAAREEAQVTRRRAARAEQATVGAEDPILAGQMAAEARVKADAAHEEVERLLRLARERGELEVGGALETARSGRGAEQAEAQKRLAELFEGAGGAGGEVAAGIRMASPAARAAAAQQFATQMATQMAIGAAVSGPMGVGGAPSFEQAARERRIQEQQAEKQKHEAERKAEEAQREQEKAQREREQATAREASRVRGVFGDDVSRSILAREQRQLFGMPAPRDDVHNERMAQAIAREVQGQKDAQGNEIDAVQARVIAEKIVRDINQELQAQIIRNQQEFARIMQGHAGELQELWRAAFGVGEEMRWLGARARNLPATRQNRGRM